MSSFKKVWTKSILSFFFIEDLHKQSFWHLMSCLWCYTQLFEMKWILCLTFSWSLSFSKLSLMDGHLISILKGPLLLNNDRKISAGADGGPRSRVRARLTLHSAPIYTSGNLSGRGGKQIWKMFSPFQAILIICLKVCEWISEYIHILKMNRYIQI